MPTYVNLLNWTEQGVRDFQKTTDRNAEARRTASEMGGKIKDSYWTLGPFDLVLVSEFPDDETATAFALAVSSRGSARTTSMRAFDIDEVRSIIGKVG
jgi:uncharacterized protein with GYD domain